MDTKTLWIISAIGLGVIGWVLQRGANSLSRRTLAQVAMAVALAMVLHQLKIYRLPQGGSITAGSMVPLLLVAWAYGPWAGMLAGLVFGMMTLMIGGYVVHPAQGILDYPLAYIALGVAGFFPKHQFFGGAMGLCGRFFCHFLAGIVFFSQYAWVGWSPWIYSLALNGLFIFLEGGLCLLIVRLLPLDRLINAMRGMAYK